MTTRSWRVMSRALVALVMALAALNLGAHPAAGAIPTAIPAVTAYAGPVGGHPASSAPCTQSVWTIDVAMFQPRIDFPTVLARGVAATYIKLTEGVGYRDPEAGRSIANATAAGMPWGTYHFAQPGRNSARAEAAWAVSQGFGHGTLLPMLDFEVSNTGLSGAQMDQWVWDFEQAVVQATGRISVIYTGAYVGVGGTLDALSQFPLWIANYGPNVPNVAWDNPCYRSQPPVPWAWRNAGWSIWQHNSATALPGIGVATDQSIMTPELFASMTGAQVAPNDSPTNDPATADQVAWGVGSRGPKVAQIQQVVGAGVDGEYGPDTARRVAQWQRFLGLPADGVWGPDTEARTAALFDLLAAGPAPADLPPVRSGPVLSLGARGPAVCDLQQAIIAHGYGGHGLTVDCAFGPVTASRVRAVELGEGLTVDAGVAGPHVWAVLA